MKRLAGVLLVSTLACNGGTTDGGGNNTAAGPCLDEAGAATVVIDDFSFDVPTGVKAGQVVTIRNEDSTTHTFTMADGSIDTNGIPSGGSCSVRFETAGTFPFFCKIHESTMGGVITVET